MSFELPHRTNKDKADGNNITMSPSPKTYSCYHKDCLASRYENSSTIHFQRSIGNEAAHKHVSSKGGFNFATIAITNNSTLKQLKPSICPCGGGCPTCSSERMGENKRDDNALNQPKLIISQPGDEYEQQADRIAEQVMTSHDIGASVLAQSSKDQLGMNRKCKSCQIRPEEEEGVIYRKPLRTSASETTYVIATEINGIRSGSSSSLDFSTRQFMESRFGYDFRNVRIHTDERASKSAYSVNSLAYTVGNDIVFGEGQYKPDTLEGRRLLAHELVHVIQQAKELSPSPLQRQPSPGPAPVDQNAQNIIDLAQDRSRPIHERAVAVVQAIITNYYPNEASKISRIVYRENERGLHITYEGRGASTTGILGVGRYFVENTTQRHFARRVAQVRHEIEHVEQQRAGMVGERRQDEREFFAFYHEALFQELPGTGRIQHSTRVQLIDGALGYYYCLSADLQTANSTRRDELIARRSREVQRSGRTDLGRAPTGCSRQ
jgi:Domain of unknown function (DUF4157)